MRRALRRRTAVVVFAAAGQPQQRWAAAATMGDAAIECFERAGREGQCFCNYYRWEVMTQTFGQLGSGSGLTRRVGRGASTEALPHRLLGWLAVVKWCGVAACECPLALQREHLLKRRAARQTFASRRTGPNAQNSCAGQRIDAVTSHNTPLATLPSRHESSNTTHALRPGSTDSSLHLKAPTPISCS